jgi:importin subunit alpha-6/7
VGNIVTGDDAQTQLVINLNALPALLWMLDNSKKNIRKEACWTLSNVTAGTAEQIQSVINACVFPKLIQLLGSSEFDIQKEAAWAVSNATSGGSPSQIMYLAQQGTLRYTHHPIHHRPYSPFVHMHTSFLSTPLLSL